MKNITKLLAIILCIAALVGVTQIPVSAATLSASYGDEAENTGDLVYWNGSKMVKSQSTSTAELRWMQKMLNHCIRSEGLKATLLTVDGRFGPASKAATLAFQKATGLTPDGKFGPMTIQKIKAVVNDGKRNSLTAPTVEKTTGFRQKNILQGSAAASTNYISGSWSSYKPSKACKNTVAAGGCGIVSLVSAVYNLGGTLETRQIPTAIQDMINWAYQNGHWNNSSYWTLFAAADDKFGKTYGFDLLETDRTYGCYGSKGKVNTSLDALVSHLKKGGTAVIHVNNHFMAAVDCRENDGKTEVLIFDPGAGNGSRRGAYTAKEGSWISLEVLKEGSVKNSLNFSKYLNVKSQENIEIDAYWLISRG